MEHKCQVVEQKDPSQKFPFLVTCTKCGWEGRFYSKAQAEQEANRHLQIRAASELGVYIPQGRI